MAYDKNVIVRLSQQDVEALDRKARYFHTSRSEVIRSLINLPIVTTESALAKNADDELHVIVFDKKILRDLKSQIKRYGYHYDQGIRALNTIAKHGLLKVEKNLFFWEQAKNELEQVNEATPLIRAEIERVEALAKTRTWLEELSD